MNRTLRILAVIAIAVAIAAGAIGCGKIPTAPRTVTPSRSATPSVDPGASIRIDLEPITPPLVEELITTVADIDGSAGGTVVNNRWMVAVPAGAFDGVAPVAVKVASPAADHVELEIPPDKNGFRVPVMLTVDCSTIDPNQLTSYAIFWFNPVTRNYEMVPGSNADPEARTVTAPLQHFSSYAVAKKDGKASW